MSLRYIKFPFKFLIDLLCGDDDMEVIGYSCPEKGRIEGGKEGENRGWGNFYDDIKC